MALNSRVHPIEQARARKLCQILQFLALYESVESGLPSQAVRGILNLNDRTARNDLQALSRLGLVVPIGEKKYRKYKISPAGLNKVYSLMSIGTADYYSFVYADSTPRSAMPIGTRANGIADTKRVITGHSAADRGVAALVGGRPGWVDRIDRGYFYPVESLAGGWLSLVGYKKMPDAQMRSGCAVFGFTLIQNFNREWVKFQAESLA